MGWYAHPFRARIAERRRATNRRKEMPLTVKPTPANPETPLEGT
jgi:hypothetical protein